MKSVVIKLDTIDCISFRTEKEFQMFLSDYEGTAFAAPGPKSVIVWCLSLIHIYSLQSRQAMKTVSSMNTDLRIPIN